MTISIHYEDNWLHAVIALLNTAGGRLTVLLPPGMDESDAACDIQHTLETAIQPFPREYLAYERPPAKASATVDIVARAGLDAPYFDAHLGMAEGSFRYWEGRMVCLTHKRRMAMIREHDGDAYETQRSLRQDITLDKFRSALQAKGLALGRPQRLTLKLVGSHGLYTNLAYMLSDQFICTMEFLWIEGREPIGRINGRMVVEATLVEMSDAFCQAIEVFNDRRAQSQRTINWRKDFPVEAMKELAHVATLLMDFRGKTRVRCCLYDDRLELYALGGPPENVSGAGVYAGESVCRNPRLIEALGRLNPTMSNSLNFSQYKFMFRRVPAMFGVEHDGAEFRITLPCLNPRKDSKASSPYRIRSLQLLALLEHRDTMPAEEIMRALRLDAKQTAVLLHRMYTDGLVDIWKGEYQAGAAAFYPAKPRTLPVSLPCIPMPDIAGLETLGR